MNNRLRKKNAGLRKEQHLAAGQKLREIKAQLEAVSAEVRLSYGRTNRVSIAATQAVAALDKLRSALDGELAKETTVQEWQAEKLAPTYSGSAKDERVV